MTKGQICHDRNPQIPQTIAANLPFGHEGENAALPVGVRVKLDSNTGTLDFIGVGK